MIRQGRGSSMDSMVRILDERAEDFAEALTEVGFSTAEAHRFLKGAAPALLRSCEWQYAALGQESLDEPASAREILSLIPGRSLASQLGLPVEKTWAGLRELVPAVLQASQSGRPGARTGGVRPSVRRSTNPSTTHYDFGFGLTLEREPRDGASKGFSADNLLFGGRLSRQD